MGKQCRESLAMPPPFFEFASTHGCIYHSLRVTLWVNNVERHMIASLQ